MDFHLAKQTLLLLETNMGDIAVWEVGSRDKLAFKNFKVWDLGACSVTLQASLASEYSASVNRLMWSRDGTLFGVAYSKHIVHIYSFHGGDDLRNLLEVWDVATGAKQYSFEGHDAPVYFVWPHHKENIQKMKLNTRVWIA
ncbi:hypothetical protein POM88_025229 [Heracleum sosnowskyi]|uniref:Uncharacterized protein n=1 Tax=Heracleum sosnowskyi TaxID=360622 RepID=A0AAD8I4S4_9APIA|nr:hypothetical protein POM88_025229 [Heracleum sosnowskyi]